jgi:hypothetical protein
VAEVERLVKLVTVLYNKNDEKNKKVKTWDSGRVGLCRSLLVGIRVFLFHV